VTVPGAVVSTSSTDDEPLVEQARQTLPPLVEEAR
jgi:hypothetical protein